MELNFTQETLEKIIAAPSADKLMNIVNENCFTISAADAENLYAALHPQGEELSDDQIENIAGGVREALSSDEIEDIYSGDLLPTSCIGHTDICADESLSPTKEVRRFVKEISQILSSGINFTAKK